MFEKAQADTTFIKTLPIPWLESLSTSYIMNNAANNYRVIMIRKEDEDEIDIEFDLFLDEEEIDIDTFVVPPLPKCSICTLPFPFDYNFVVFKTCCGNTICTACGEATFYGELKRQLEENVLRGVRGRINLQCTRKCQFCRSSNNSEIGDIEKLAQRGNSHAKYLLASAYENGEGVPVDGKKALELYHIAAREDCIEACELLGSVYCNGSSFGDIVIRKDKGKAMRLFIRGARLGDIKCLYSIGLLRFMDRKIDYFQYFLKAASAGYQEALDMVKAGYIAKIITKDEYANTLRSFQAVHDEINSEARKRFNERLAAKQTFKQLFEMNQRERDGIMRNIILGNLV